MDAFARGHRFDEAQVVEAVVRKHRARRRVDEQTCGERQQQIAVRHAAREERIGLRGFFVHMCVEFIAGEFGEVLDVRDGDFASRGRDGVTGLQLAELQAERMARRGCLRSAREIGADNTGEKCRAALQRGTLHIMFDAAHAAHFFAAAGAPRAAVHEHGQR